VRWSSRNVYGPRCLSRARDCVAAAAACSLPAQAFGGVEGKLRHIVDTFKLL
jgi:hypothetical protein